MDQVRADRMTQELLNQQINGWVICKYKGAGKSAVVFECEKEGKKAAVKVFDPELIERFGKDTQLKRIERECSLINENHPNLVQIYDGGECHKTGYLYVAMEFIDADNLKDCLELVPRDKIKSIINQIASAASFLEEKMLAHRDIKPDNVAIFPDYSRAVLLDLGVLRPFGDASLTDGDARVFIGTLRYSSPEFLLRKEKDTIEGWRAVTFYQLGAVLHDLIMRQPLFNKYTEPFAMLVEAVKSEKPIIHADDVSADLVLLAQNCLVKSPEARISLVSWSDFSDTKPATRSLADSARDRVMKRMLQSRLQSGEVTSDKRLSSRQIAQYITGRIDNIVRNICIGNSSFPPLEIVQNTDSIQVCVIFASSSICGLSQKLSIRFDSRIVDEETMSLSMVASACFLMQGSSHGDPSTTADVFKGTLDSPNLEERIQDILWIAIDQAQQQILSTVTGHEVCWLNLVINLEG